MTDILGVEINLSKSLQSDKSVVEFAKRLVSPDAEYTPLGANLLLQVARQAVGVHSLFIDSIHKGVSWSFETVNNLLENQKLFTNHWLVLGPFGVIPHESSPLPFLKVTGSLKYSDLVNLISDLYRKRRERVNATMLDRMRELNTLKRR